MGVLCALWLKTSLATGNNQWFTDYHHRDTERTEDSQRPKLFYYQLDTARNQAEKPVALPCGRALAVPRAWPRILARTWVRERNGDGAPAAENAGMQGAVAI